MNPKSFDISFLSKLNGAAPIRNYVIPGLSSYMLGAPGVDGSCVRLFEASRSQLDSVTPHSHRYSLMSWVVRGWVRNRLWREVDDDHAEGEAFRTSWLRYDGAPGKYKKEIGGVSNWVSETRLYREGECYTMEARDVHSIYFSKDALVLVFQGHNEMAMSKVIEPVVDGQVIPTLKTAKWMFKQAK